VQYFALLLACTTLQRQWPANKLGGENQVWVTDLEVGRITGFNEFLQFGGY